MLFLRSLPPRIFRVQPSSISPFALYTDGSENASGRTICGVLFHPSLQRPQFFRYQLPHDVLAKWIIKDTMINQVEACAGIVALDTWSNLLVSSEIIHFIDSNTSLHSLVNGWSRMSDTCHLVGEYWRRAARLRCYPWLERVESGSNVADGPTEENLTLMESLCAVEVSPDVSGL